jgi:hypothetical protein
MLDQADYSGINEYVQKHGLQDASLAATRRAKKLNVNPPAEGNGEDVKGEDGLTELERAQQELEDLEDEEEEDYDPGDEGDDGGSGTDSEEDEDGEEYGEEYGEEGDLEGELDDEEDVLMKEEEH